MDDLSFDLHALVVRLDRSADRILRSELGVSYRRFLALFMVRDLGAATQRALADRLEVSEPSVSRMTSVLQDAGLLVAETDPSGGNRHRLRLTPAVQREHRFDPLEPQVPSSLLTAVAMADRTVRRRRLTRSCRRRFCQS